MHTRFHPLQMKRLIAIASLALLPGCGGSNKGEVVVPPAPQIEVPPAPQIPQATQVDVPINAPEFFQAIKDGQTERVSAALARTPLWVNTTFGNADDYPLHFAAAAGHVEIAQALLAKGAQVNQLNKNRVTPIAFAVSNDRVEMVDFLLRNGGDAAIADVRGVAPYMFARDTQIKALLERYRPKGIFSNNGFFDEGGAGTQTPQSAATSRAERDQLLKEAMANREALFEQAVNKTIELVGTGKNLNTAILMASRGNSDLMKRLKAHFAADPRFKEMTKGWSTSGSVAPATGYNPPTGASSDYKIKNAEAELKRVASSLRTKDAALKKNYSDAQELRRQMKSASDSRKRTLSSQHSSLAVKADQLKAEIDDLEKKQRSLEAEIKQLKEETPK